MKERDEHDASVELPVGKGDRREHVVEDGDELRDDDEIERERERDVGDEEAIREYAGAVGQRGREDDRLGDVLKARDEEHRSDLVAALALEPGLRAHHVKGPQLR